MPIWATLPNHPNFPEPLHKPYAIDPFTGMPSEADCALFDWADYSFTFACASAYQALYDNEYGAADAFGAFWAKAAALFKGNPNVIGFGAVRSAYHARLLTCVRADERALCWKHLGEYLVLASRSC